MIMRGWKYFRELLGKEILGLTMWNKSEEEHSLKMQKEKMEILHAILKFTGSIPHELICKSV